MSAGIKAMLAERAHVEALKTPVYPPYEPIDDLFEMIDTAARFIDEGSPPDKWAPSDKLKMAYFVMSTGESGPKRAAEFIERMLDKARELWLAGVRPPNPWVAK